MSTSGAKSAAAKEKSRKSFWDLTSLIETLTAIREQTHLGHLLSVKRNGEVLTTVKVMHEPGEPHWLEFE